MGAVPSRPPCTFCGCTGPGNAVGFRAIICPTCVEAIKRRLHEIERTPATGAPDGSVAGTECVFCERILSGADFSLRRWVFSICCTCACSISDTVVDYQGTPAQVYAF